MNRSAAVILTGLTFLLCGLPGLFTCVFGAQMAIGSTNPSYRDGFESGSGGMSPDIILPIGLGVMGFALLLIVIPILVGFITFRVSRPKEVPNR